MVFVLGVVGCTSAASTSHNNTVKVVNEHNNTKNTVSESSIQSDVTINSTTSSSSQTSPDPRIMRNGVVLSTVYTSIQAAVNAAQSGDTILLENGQTFTITSAITINKSLTFDIGDANGIIANGSATISGSSTRLVNITANSIIVTFNKITFTNGSVTGQGAAVYNNYSGVTLTFNNCSFTSNTANSGWFSQGNGGAIYNAGTLTTNSCIFTSNSAANYGGAIYNTGTLYVDNSVFNLNRVTGNTQYTGGGAIYNNASGNFSVSNSTFSSNSAPTGGAIISMTAATITGSTFNNNNANQNNGGAISFGVNNNTPGTGTITISDNYFSGNTATSNGGAIWSGTNGTCIISNNNFVGNKATENGGAIRTWGSTTVTSNNFYNNTAGTAGGAISVYQGITTAQFNRFISNGTNDVNVVSRAGTFSGNLNWWGVNTGPATGRVTGSNSTISSWLVLKITASPTSIPVNGTSNVVATLLYDNNGNYHDPASGCVPNAITNIFTGIPANFTGTLGTVSPTSSVFYNGTANTTFTGKVPGLGSVSATVDNQTVSTNIVIGSADLEVWVYDNTGVTDWLYGLSPQYVVEVDNNGPDEATNVIVTITLPSSLQLNGYNPETGGNVTINGNILTWNVGTICSGGSTGIDILARITGTGTIPLTATVTQDQTDPNTSNNTDTWNTYVPLSADIQVTQTVSNQTPTTGSSLTYTVTITNNGPDTANNIIIDLTQTGLTGTTYTPSTGNYSNGIWTITQLTNGATATLTITGTTTSTITSSTASLQAVDEDNWNETNDNKTLYSLTP